MPFKVLFVDDYQANCMMCTDLLEMTGNSIEVAHNGLEAFNKIKAGEVFDAILMDVNMPVMDGIEASRKIRQLPGGETIMIIGMSGDGFENKAECLANGMTMVVGKPFYPEHVIDLIRKYKESNVVPVQEKTVTMQPSTGTCLGVETPIFDYAKVIDEFQGDVSLVNDVLEEFLQELTKHCSIMDACIHDNNLNTLRQEAHKVKGGACNICALRLAQAAKGIEACCAEGKIDKAENAVGIFKAEVKVFSDCAKKEICRAQ